MTINVITPHGWLGNLERDNVARECGFCGEEIPPRAWMTVSRRQPDDGQYRKPLRVCIACADVIAWAGEAGWEEDGIVDPEIADGWAHSVLNHPVTHQHYRSQSAAHAYRERRAEKADKEWKANHDDS